jgi:hypothetical protein
MSLVCCSCRKRGKARLDTVWRNRFVGNGFRLREGVAGCKAWCEYRCGARWRTGS